MEPNEQNDTRPPPGVYRTKGGIKLFELRYSSTGAPILVSSTETRCDPALKDYELVEPGATLDSPLFRASVPSPEGPSDDERLLRLTEAALRGLATNAYNDVGDGEGLGIVAAQAARAALATLRCGERSRDTEEPIS